MELTCDDLIWIPCSIAIVGGVIITGITFWESTRMMALGRQFRIPAGRVHIGNASNIASGIFGNTFDGSAGSAISSHFETGLGTPSEIFTLPSLLNAANSIPPPYEAAVNGTDPILEEGESFIPGAGEGTDEEIPIWREPVMRV